LHDTDITAPEMTDLVTGLIGEGLAVKFMAHRKVAGQMPKPEDILIWQGKRTKDQRSQCHVLTDSVFVL
jgi:hypothetical protein